MTKTTKEILQGLYVKEITISEMDYILEEKIDRLMTRLEKLELQFKTVSNNQKILKTLIEDDLK